MAGRRQVLTQPVQEGRRISALAYVNTSTESPLLLVGSDDGTVRVWSNVGTVQRGRPMLLSAFHAVPDINLMRPGQPGGWKPLVMEWQQRRSLLAAAGPAQHGDDHKVKLWDLQAHRCYAQVQLCSDYPVSTLQCCQGQDLLWVGCVDGSVRLVDTRMHHSVGLIAQSTAVGQGKSLAPVLRVQVVEGYQHGGGSQEKRIVSATAGGSVMFWDVRNASRPSETLETGFPITAFAAHRHLPLLACGSHKQFVKVFSHDGKQLSSIEHHQGFFGQRIGPVSAIEFHPTERILAFGAVDPYVYVRTL